MKFDKAIKKMIKYLNSDEFQERGTGDSDAKDTLKSIHILTKINRKGYLTVDSQEGVNRMDTNIITKKKYKHIERAYIIGFMKTKQALKYNEKINKTDKVSIIIMQMPTKYFEKNYTTSKYWIPLTNSNNKIFTRMSASVPESHFDFQRKLAHINKSEHIEMVFTFDPVWGRKASSKNGLYKDVINSL